MILKRVGINQIISDEERPDTDVMDTVSAYQEVTKENIDSDRKQLVSGRIGTQQVYIKGEKYQEVYVGGIVQRPDNDR